MPTPLHLKPPMARWIVSERKRLGWKPKDIADKLAAINRVVSEATVKVWESNADRRPDPYNVEGLEQIFGSTAPGRTTLPADQSAVVAALDRQTDQISRQADALIALIRRLDDLAMGQKALGEEVGSLVDRDRAVQRLAEVQTETPPVPPRRDRAQPSGPK